MKKISKKPEFYIDPKLVEHLEHRTTLRMLAGVQDPRVSREGLTAEMDLVKYIHGLLVKQEATKQGD